MKDWEKGYWLGVLAGSVGIGLLALVLFYSEPACAQTSWENNPLNYKNSPYNYDNSQYNYKNSQYNWENSPYNMDSKRGIYSNDGAVLATKCRIVRALATSTTTMATE